MSDRCLVTAIIHDHTLEMNYMISRILVANLLPAKSALKTHKKQPWWMTSDNLPRGDAEVMFIPGDVIDSADGECSGAMYELASQSLYKSDLFDFFSKLLGDEVNSGRISISYSVATSDDENGVITRKMVRGMREVYDCVVLSLVYMWRLSHQLTLANASMRRLFSVAIPANLMDTLSEYHTLLARGNNSFPKIVPLTVSEVTRPYDITLKFWRECELLQISTDLCYMYLGTGMPLMSVVTPIYGMTEAMYRNVNLIRKYRMGERYVNEILEARREIESSKGPHSDSLIAMARRDPDDYIVTDFAGLIIMPYSGLSVAHVLTGARGAIIRDSFLWSLRERLLDPLVFKQLYMNWLVTLYNLHFIGGIVHGDLHAGNVTMYTNYTGYEQKYLIPRGPDIDVYIQKSGDPYIGRIIDFSRSFITGKGPIRTRHSDVAISTVLEEQSARLHVSISRAFPGLYDKTRVADILAGDDWGWLGIIDEVYLSRALLAIFTGLRDGKVDANFISSRLQDGSSAEDAKIEKMNVPKEIITILEGFISAAELYFANKLRGVDMDYPSVPFMVSSGFFDDMKCSTVTKTDGLKIGDDVDDMKHHSGACSANGGNRCISSLVSFGTTIRDDIYMALVDAGDKFPNADKDKIRMMLDIHDRNDEWYTLAESVLNE